ncbi:hypothetical protein NQZ79_g8247 [Umbelopsis isabellina]|nr:hypothetical protein NQZ79_g8247 [Umbelopsis isabellina]
MIDAWIESALTPVQATERRDAETVEKGYKYLYDYINFMDHLRALVNDSYKYSRDELQTVEEKLHSNLNVMHLYSVKTTQGRYGHGIDLGGISELPIDWSPV